MAWYVNCANCGKQVSIDEPESICYWCGKNASKKEVITQEQKVPRKPKKRKALWEYYERNKEVILADYQSLKLRDFFKRWKMSSNTWGKLRTKWEVQGKGRPTPKPQKTKDGKPSATDKEVLTEHERYLILLGYQMAVREILTSETLSKMR